MRLARFATGLPRRRAATTVLAVVALVSMTPPAGAQDTWTSLDGSPAGTAAQVILVPTASGATLTTFDVLIHGFYTRPRIGPDKTTYQQIEIPGLQKLSILGAPELPVVRVPLAIVTGAPSASLVQMTPLTEPQSFTMHVWPQPVPARDDSFGTPEVFTIDPAIYTSAEPYPAVLGTGSPTYMALGSIPASRLECHPIRWTPATDQLVVQPATRWQFSHDGAVGPFAPITRDRNRMASQMFVNWSSMVQFVPPNVIHYQGEYLFLYSSAYAAALKPLILQKKARGFTVAQITTESLGSATCSSVRAAIQGWYASTPSVRDHYCLLVGDLQTIPHCASPGWPDANTDDLYGSVHGDDLARDIFVGRLPVASATDVANEVKKIIDYEDHPVASPSYYGYVLLAAHQNDQGQMCQGCGFYAAEMESIRANSYAVHPIFIPYYGTDTGRNNAGLSAYVNSGVGITSYRGHGYWGAWAEWNTYGENFDANNVNALSNGPLTTIVWSIACSNSDLREGNCIGRVWLTKYPGGGAAHYGSTRPSGTEDNRTLADRLFHAVWDKGITNLAHATTWAEDECLLWDFGQADDNAWAYALFGDPDMNVRRTLPSPWVISTPAVVPALGAHAPLDIRVSDPTGTPVSGALVAVWKPGAETPGGPAGPGGGDEVFDNAYSGGDGFAHFLVQPKTTGALYFSVRDSAGNSVADSIEVVNSTGVPPAPKVRLAMRVTPSVTRASTTIRFSRGLEAATELRIFDAAGRSFGALAAPRGATEVVWPGTSPSGSRLPSGLYFVRLSAEGVDQVVRVVVRR